MPKPPKPSVSETIDREQAAAALEKRRKGEKPTELERKALARLERAREEEQRWAFYGTIPQKHWRAMSGRVAKTINEQADKYGIPFNGRTVDLPSVVRALHDFLAKNWHKLLDKPEPDAADPSQVCRAEAERRKSAEQAAIFRLRRLVMEGEFISRDIHNRATIRNDQIIRRKIEDYMIEGLAPVLCPDDPAWARRILTDAYDRLCADMEALKRIDIAGVAAVKANGRAKDPKKVKAVKKRHSGKGKA